MTKYSFIILLFLSFRLAHGQDTINDLNISLRPAGINSIDGVSAGLEVDYFKNRLLFSIDYHYSEEFVILNSSVPRQFQQIALSIGKYYRHRHFDYFFEIGFAGIKGTKRGEYIGQNGHLLGDAVYDGIKYYTIGVPLKTGFRYVPRKKFGIGLDLLGNFNREETMGALMIVIDYRIKIK
jgi:hypothetical protein